MSKQDEPAKQEWIKPNGRSITVNDNEDNAAQAKKLGWKKAKSGKKAA